METEGALTSVERGCPFDCGLCPEHLRRACVVVVEVTHSCNLSCPVCFSTSKAEAGGGESLESLDRIFRTVIRYEGAKPPPTLQLSGGEPTLRDDLPEIAALAAERGLMHLMVNTNGLRLARERDYLRRLKESGADMLYLQFDGVTGDVYRKVRGADLLEAKLKALRNCAEVGVGVVLVPTVIRGVNLHQVGEIIEFAKGWMPMVRGIHFQPITYTGRCPSPEGRVTIPELLHAIEDQTRGQLSVNNFIPMRCETHCAFGTLALLTEEGRLQPTTHFPQPEKVEELMERREKASGAKPSREEMLEYWTAAEGAAPSAECECRCSCQSLQGAYGLARRSLAVSGMAFQDVYNIDTARLRKCCVHVATPDSRLIPFCSYYLTSATGERLYRAGAR